MLVLTAKARDLRGITQPPNDAVVNDARCAYGFRLLYSPENGVTVLSS